MLWKNPNEVFDQPIILKVKTSFGEDWRERGDESDSKPLTRATRRPGDHALKLRLVRFWEEQVWGKVRGLCEMCQV